MQKKKNSVHVPTSCVKIHSKWITGQNVKPKCVKPPEENI